MPAPKATSHGFGGSGGAAGLTFISAASAGVASATAATALKINFFIGCPFQSNATPATLLLVGSRPCFHRSRVPLFYVGKLTTRQDVSEGKSRVQCYIVKCHWPFQLE